MEMAAALADFGISDENMLLVVLAMSATLARMESIPIEDATDRLRGHFEALGAERAAEFIRSATVASSELFMEITADVYRVPMDDVREAMKLGAK